MNTLLERPVMLKMSDPVVQAIVQARVALLFDDPWYGNLVTRLELISTDEIDTFVVSYDQLRFDNRSVKNMSPAQLIQKLRLGIDELVAALANLPSSNENESQRRAFVAAVKNADIATGFELTNRIEHVSVGQNGGL